MIRKLLLAISFLSCAAMFAGTPTVNGTDDAGAFVPCLNPGTGLPDATCFQLFIRNPALTGTRFDPADGTVDVDIRERVPAGAAAVGSVIFFTGNFGDDYYDTPPTHTCARRGLNCAPPATASAACRSPTRSPRTAPARS